VDGFNTSDIIDTYSYSQGFLSDGSPFFGNVSLPQCFPVQYPPFTTPPPSFNATSNHEITLVYIGPSAAAPPGPKNVQFDGFAIPIFVPVTTTKSSGSATYEANMKNVVVAATSVVGMSVIGLVFGML
jgi:hypothetical protein